MIYSYPNIVKGGLIYAAGDTIASLILDEFMLSRLIGMMLVGMTIYAFEIPNYFRWIEKKTTGLSGLKLSLSKTGFAVAYFNPLWIARHLLFIQLVSLNLDQISWGLLIIASYSFLVNIPISIFANYIIQNVITLRWRFVASAIFSGLMAVYYAMSTTWFV